MMNDELQKEVHELRYEELDIQDELKDTPSVVNGQLDYTQYDKLMSRLREVRAKITSLVR